MLSMRDSPNVEVSSRPSHLLRTGDSIAEICCGFFAVAFQESPNHQFKFPATPDARMRADHPRGLRGLPQTPQNSEAATGWSEPVPGGSSTTPFHGALFRQQPQGQGTEHTDRILYGPGSQPLNAPFFRLVSASSKEANKQWAFV